jgi:hypothetical protein
VIPPGLDDMPDFEDRGDPSRLGMQKFIAILPVKCGCPPDEQGHHAPDCPLDTPDPHGEGHDNDCESEFYMPPGSWTPCRCLDRYNEKMESETNAAADIPEREL